MKSYEKSENQSSNEEKLEKEIELARIIAYEKCRLFRTYSWRDGYVSG